ncbi:replication initiation and membrane attachment family protein [Listeria sp. PSOL-1]|uniref:replication initiation and membrane attachment family protein n=1 Tax=Listeria sp. PSOL-1 TaxID=1844999 RepID=UPI0013D23C22|nr:DnaD domain protein [Listeria sp. PSOL-1]
MTEFWMELKPLDSYQVKSNGVLSSYDYKVITMLYQPLMGSNCLALYQTLATEIEENRLWSEAHTHTQLLNLLNIGLKDFFSARLKLEGLGLLKSYIKTEADARHYIYELIPPLTPDRFFSDGLLNIYLYGKIGSRQYQRLRKFFSDDHEIKPDFHEITRSFQDVFSPFNSNLKAPEIVQTNETPINRTKTPFIELSEEEADFDFSLFFHLLSPNMIARNKITAEVKQTILKLHAIYQYNEKEMVSFLYRAILGDGNIDLAYLRKIVRDDYRLHHQAYPELHDFNLDEATPNKTELNDEEALQVYLENVSPFQLLVDITDGATPAETDLRVIEEVMTKQNLPEPVMNVLIEYVLLRLDGKIARNYMMTIAAHWKRKKVKTAKEAMELALSEHEKYKRLKEEGPKTTSYQKNNRVEVLPDWFDREEVTPAEEKMSEKEKLALEEQVRQIKENLKKGR